MEHAYPFNARRLAQTVGAILCAAVASGAEAEESRSFDIPPQALAAALNRFSETVDMQLSYPAELTEGMQSPGVSGTYTPERALEKLLDGSGLKPRVTGNDIITIERPGASLSTEYLLAQAPKENYPVTATDETRYDGPVKQEDLTVNGGDWSGYNVLNASTATKTDTPILDIPMNIQVVPRTLMDDQQDIRITDALVKNVSGIQAFHGSGNIYENFYIRGFQTGNIYRNGLLRGFNTYDPANIEQLEVIKGPASMLYGRTQPGGLINYVTKKGLQTPTYSIQQQLGTYDQYRTTLDATGPIDQNGELSYRLNFAYQDIGSFKQFVNDERYFVAPTLSWRPSDRFEANLEIEYKHEEKVNDWGIPSIGNRPAPVPLNRSYLDSASAVENDTTLVAYDWSFKLNDDWKLANRFLWENWDIQYNDIGGATKLQADNRTLNRVLITGPANQETYATNLDLTGKLRFLNTSHEILIGGDYYHNAFDGPNERYSIMEPIDIFNPVYNVLSQADIDARPLDWNFLRREERFGVYFQDHITLFDKLHLLGGGRYDWVTYGTAFSGTSFEEAKANFSGEEDQKFSPRVGILYQPWESLSLYGSYSESLGSANQGFSFSGESFKPEEGEQYEAGFKTELFDQRFSTTVSYFHLNKTNTTMNDPDHPNFRITAGKVRSRGIEVDVKGQISEQLSLVTTYAFTDIRYVKANANLQGQRPINIPEHQASLWGTYQFDDHFKVGLGGVAVGKRLGDNFDPVELPGYVRMDMMAAYTLPLKKTRLTAQINVNNVLDKDYYQGSGYNRNSITTGEPITAMGSLRLQF